MEIKKWELREITDGLEMAQLICLHVLPKIDEQVKLLLDCEGIQALRDGPAQINRAYSNALSLHLR